MLQAAPKNVHIYLESNPNPNSLKFVVNEMLVPEAISFDFPDAESTGISPLAQELFSFPFVDRVFFASNFITVTKKEDVEWLEIQSTLKEHIKKYLEAGKFIIEVNEESSASAEEETETIKKIKTILDEYIRPAVEQDGGSGTAGSHWDEDTFHNELMTGYIDSGSNPFSAMSAASFADLGYVLSGTYTSHTDPYAVV